MNPLISSFLFPLPPSSFLFLFLFLFPRYLAAQNGHISVVRLLLKRGAAVDARLRKIEITSLFVAAERGHAGVVEELLRGVKGVKGVKGRKGASPHIRNWNGITPLAMAAIRGHVGLVERIAAAGGKVDTEDNEGTGLRLH